MANGLLGTIANPALAQPAQAGFLGQQQKMALEGARQQLEQSQRADAARRAMGEIFAQRFTGKLADLSRLDPQQALVVAEATGIPVDQPGRIKHFAGLAQITDTLMRQVGPQEAYQFLLEERNTLNEMGAPTPRIDQFLQRFQQDPGAAAADVAALTEAFKQVGVLKTEDQTEQKPKQKTGAFLVRDPNTGETKLATGVFDPNTGQLETSETSFGGGEVVSKLGETAAEESLRKIEQQRLGTRATTEEKRISGLIERGIQAAEGTATVRRGIDLLNRVKTGGVAAIGFEARRRLGIEGADEGELSNSLGKAVLSQLRETFGAAFTAAEGQRLERIEASFGKSVATNQRLLEQALRIMERTANRAKKAAEKRGDEETVDDIDDLLTFSLNIAEPEKEPTASTIPTITTQEDYDALPSGTIFLEDSIQYRKP